MTSVPFTFSGVFNLTGSGVPDPEPPPPEPSGAIFADGFDGPGLRPEWNDLDGLWICQNGTAIMTPSSGHARLLCTVTLPSDHTVSADHITGSAGRIDSGLFVRSDLLMSNGYFGRFHHDGVCQIYRVVNGVFTLLASSPGGSLGRHTLSAVGGLVSFATGGVVRVSVTDPNPLTGTRAGIRGFIGGTFDNYEAGPA